MNMEVLNKNQRESALWRLFGLGTIIVFLNAIVLIATHNTYALQGKPEVNALKTQLTQEQDQATQSKQQLEADKKELEGKLMAKDKIIADQQRKIESLDERVETLKIALEAKEQPIVFPPGN